MENIFQLPRVFVTTIMESINRAYQWFLAQLTVWKPLPGKITRWIRSPWFPLLWLIPLVLSVYVIFVSLPRIMGLVPGMIPVSSRYEPIADSIAVGEQIRKEEQSIGKLQKDLDRLTPRSPYLVINTTSNTFKLYKSNALVREGICSTGSYTLLTDGKDRRWFFETPKGVYRIRYKTTNPVWRKPDWAFVEEGQPVPPANHPSRIEYGTLGDYALGLGDGYLIHGTLYQRFLGMPVTHGCVRLGDDDLEEVFRTLPVGAPVYIY